MTSQVQTANCRKNDLESLFLLAWVQQIRQYIEVLEEELHVTKISIYITMGKSDVRWRYYSHTTARHEYHECAKAKDPYSCCGNKGRFADPC